ncbi:MAG: hypothetical protein ACRD5K_03065 [Candidatus Acidiferrales bacterium]
MPFINGRYYLNPVMGEALEAAREAEAALAVLDNRARQDSGETGGEANDDFGGVPGSPSDAASGTGDGPIHRVEIEAAEMVPASSGRAARGYVARVHRQNASGSVRSARNFTDRRTAKIPGGAETLVFADHRDLVSFLRDELAKDAHSRS